MRYEDLSLLSAVQPAALHHARIVAALAFLAVLGALGWGLWRARQQQLHHEADAALEQDFKRLESELSKRERGADPRR